MPSLTKKQRNQRALKDLEETGLMLHVKRRLADQCLTCPPGDVGKHRTAGAVCDAILSTLRDIVNSGDLKYHGD
jgi:hypothetical protein